MKFSLNYNTQRESLLTSWGVSCQAFVYTQMHISYLQIGVTGAHDFLTCFFPFNNVEYPSFHVNKCSTTSFLLPAEYFIM